MSMSSIAKDVREELQHSLREWGVGGEHESHVNLRRDVIRKGIMCLSETLSQPRDFLRYTKFPTSSYSAAYEHVLRHDEITSQVYSYTDSLRGEGYLNPFYRTFNRMTGKFSYKRKDEYRGHSVQELDPQQRFKFTPMTEEELLFDRWFLDDNTSSSEGLLFEAVVACHALKNKVSCHNCKCVNTLRWFGGGQASWQDLVCISCGASYEVKTKGDLEQVEKAFKYNNITGGSFEAWCRLKNSVKESEKCYLVVLPRKSTFNRQGKKGAFFKYQLSFPTFTKGLKSLPCHHRRDKTGAAQGPSWHI